MAGRKEKLGKQIQKDLGEILDAAAKQILKGTMVTVLEVVVTSDLGLAKVHISLFNTQDKAADLVLIQQNSPQIRH
ncbi:MAG: ribosome-binding factor A, partial [Bacteroidia bacterium]